MKRVAVVICLLAGILATIGCSDGNRESAPDIEGLLLAIYSEDDAEIDAAHDSLAELGPSVIPQVEAHLKIRPYDDLHPLHHVLARLGDPGLPALLARLNSHSEERISVVIALRSYSGSRTSQVVDQLTQLLVSAFTMEVRFRAAENLSAYTARTLGAAGIHALIQALGDRSKHVSRVCFEKLKSLGPAAKSELSRAREVRERAAPLIRELLDGS